MGDNILIPLEIGVIYYIIMQCIFININTFKTYGKVWMFSCRVHLFYSFNLIRSLILSWNTHCILMSRLCSSYTYIRPLCHGNRVQSICVKMSVLQDLFFCLSHKACSCKPLNKALMPAGILPPSAFTPTLKPYNPWIMTHFYSILQSLSQHFEPSQLLPSSRLYMWLK